MSSLHPSLSLRRGAHRVCVRCSVVQDPDAPLTPEQIDHFLVNGYVALPGLFPEDFNDAMKRDVDRLVDDRAAKQAAPLIASYGTLGELCSYPPIVDKVCQLMAAYGNGETACGMHHIHANRQDAGTGPSNWHQVRRAAMACAHLSISERLRWMRTAGLPLRSGHVPAGTADDSCVLLS